MAPKSTPSATARNRACYLASCRSTPREFLAQSEDATDADLPQFVKDEFSACLECGILGLHCGIFGNAFRGFELRRLAGWA